MPPIRLPTYRHQKARNRGFFEWKGRRHYLPGPYNSTESRRAFDEFCGRLLAEQLAQASPGSVPTEARAVTIAELVLGFYRFAQYRFRDQRAELGHYKKICTLLVDRHASLLVAQFGPLKATALRAEWIAAGSSRQHCNAQFGRLASVFSWGVSQELVPASVIVALREVKRLQVGHTSAPEAQRIVPTTWEIVERIRPWVPPVIWAMIRVQGLSGMRPGELCGMRAEEIDRCGSVWWYRPAHHKTAYRGHKREIALGPQSIEALLPYWPESNAGFLFSPRIAAAERKVNSRAAIRDRYDPSSFIHAIRYGFNKASRAGVNLPRWFPYQLRHMAATKARAETGSIESASALLGNSITAAQVYAQRNKELAEDLARRFG